jgi:hypothetical protein
MSSNRADKLSEVLHKCPCQIGRKAHRPRFRRWNQRFRHGN